MVKAVVLYGPPPDADAFSSATTRRPTRRWQRLSRLERFEAAQGIATPDGDRSRPAQLLFA
jgi:hypothetical protein